MVLRRGLLSMLLVLVLGLTSGCKEVLYSDLAEREANEMVALLASSGIHAGRERDKKGIYAISVESVDIPAAVMLLKAANLPSEKFLDFADIFSAEGIVSTPFEQQALYIHALNQELSHTLTNLKDIRSARVLITSPPKGRYDREPPKATASVTLEHEQSASLVARVGVIKSIVAHSVPNLDHDDVVVALFPADGPVLRSKAGGIRAPSTVRASIGGFASAGIGWRGVLMLLGGASFCAILFLLFRKPAPRPTRRRAR